MQLRTVCTWIAATIPTPEGETHPMLDSALSLSLGAGTEPAATDDGEQSATLPAAAGTVAPAAVLADDGQVPDAPPSVRAGQPSPGEGQPLPAGVAVASYEKALSVFGAGMRPR